VRVGLLEGADSAGLLVDNLLVLAALANNRSVLWPSRFSEVSSGNEERPRMARITRISSEAATLGCVLCFFHPCPSVKSVVKLVFSFCRSKVAIQDGLLRILRGRLL
jgi:hypothetical protein